MYIVYTLRTILRFDGIADWPAGKSAFNCPPTTDMNLRALVVAFQRLEQPCRFRTPWVWYFNPSWSPMLPGSCKLVPEIVSMSQVVLCAHLFRGYLDTCVVDHG